MFVHFLIHESFEAPGAFETWARTRNHEAAFTRVYENDPLPESVHSFDLLIVLGGDLGIFLLAILATPIAIPAVPVEA